MLKSDEIALGNRPAEAAHSADTAAPAADPPLLQWMKLIVIGLGVLLVLGFFTVIARMVYVASRPAAQAVAVPGAPAALRSIALPPGAVVRATSMSGSRLAVHYEAPSGPAIAIVDLDTGQVVSRLRIEHDARLPW